MRRQSFHIESRDRLEESLKVEIADRLGLHEVFDRGRQALRDQDLARLGFAKQASRKVGDAADGAVVPAPFKADRADRRVALGDADTEVEPRSRVCATGRSAPPLGRASPAPSGSRAPRDLAPARDPLKK